MGNSKLPVDLKDISPATYTKPERKNSLVPEKQYNEIDNAVVAGTKIGTNGVVYIDEEQVPKLLRENKSDAQYIIDKFIPDKYKRTIGDTTLIHTSPLVGLLDERAQETRSASKQALQIYARDSLTGVSDSDQAQSIRRNLDDFNAKEQKKLKYSRQSNVDEVSLEPLQENNSEFHHKNQKSIYTDPEKALDPDEGVLVNKTTHQDIHRKKLRDEKSLEEYKKELQSKRDNGKD